MKKISIILFLFALVLVLALIIERKKTELPDTFSLHLVTDGSSSGGDRVTIADLKYGNSILVSGLATYIAHPNGGGEINYSCTYRDGKWTNTINSTKMEMNENKDDQFLSTAIQNCSHLPQYPLTVLELQTKIKNGEFAPQDEYCGHGKTCYSIIR